MAYANAYEVAREFDLTQSIIDAAVVARDLEALKSHGTCLASTDTELARNMPNVAALLLEYCREAYRFVARDGAGYEIAPKPLMLADGTYTFVYLTGEYRTIRVRTAKSGKLAGRRLVEFLSGPDNTLDFTAFGFVNENSINVWKRFERGSLVNLAREIEAAARNDADALEAAGLAYAERSSRCRRCNKVLTVPASQAAGYGPDCAAIVGIEYGADRRNADLAAAKGTATWADVLAELDSPSGGSPVAVETRGGVTVQHMTPPPFTVEQVEAALDSAGDHAFDGMSDDEIEEMIDSAERADARAQDAFENPTGDARAAAFANRGIAELNRRRAAAARHVENSRTFAMRYGSGPTTVGAGDPSIPVNPFASAAR